MRRRAFRRAGASTSRRRSVRSSVRRMRNGSRSAPLGAEMIHRHPRGPIVDFAAALLGREIVNPDHVCWYSGTTLQRLLDRCAWRVDHLAYYALPHLVARQDFRVSDRLKLHAFNAFRVSSRPLVTMVPW